MAQLTCSAIRHEDFEGEIPDQDGDGDGGLIDGIDTSDRRLWGLGILVVAGVVIIL